jgi:hypothetical protein
MNTIPNSGLQPFPVGWALPTFFKSFDYEVLWAMPTLQFVAYSCKNGCNYAVQDAELMRDFLCNRPHFDENQV